MAVCNMYSLERAGCRSMQHLQYVAGEAGRNHCVVDATTPANAVPLASVTATISGLSFSSSCCPGCCSQGRIESRGAADARRGDEAEETEERG